MTCAPLSNSHDIARIDLDGGRLLYEPHTDHQSMALIFAEQHPSNTLKRPSDDFDEHAFLQIRMWIVRQDTGHQRLDGDDFLIRNRFRALSTAHNVDDADGFQNWQLLVRLESDEAISGEQRHFDFFLAILPLTEALDGRQQMLDALLHQLIPHHFFMTRSRPKRVPMGTVRLIRCRLNGHSFALSLTVPLQKLPGLSP